MATLPNLQSLTKDQLIALLAAANAKPQRKLSLKVSAKGAVSLYGMGRWPVTLYASQWEQVLGEVEAIKAFIETNRPLLSVKAED